MPRKLPVESRCRRRSRGGGAAYTVAHHTHGADAGAPHRLPSSRIKACRLRASATGNMSYEP
jgi:hypothetical protein